MKQNYLYKCIDCETVKSVNENLGESTWVLSCKPCGSCVTEHYKINLLVNGGCVMVCPKEKEEENALSFNFLFYMIQKFKMSDLIDQY